MNEKFKKLLQNLDLTVTQVKIYASLLENGMQTVFEIGKDTGLVRSQIYSDTIILLEKGFIELAVKSPRKFIAVSPRKIKGMITDKKEKLDELEGGLDGLANIFENRFKRKGNNVSTKIYENRNIYKVFDFELEDAKGGVIYMISGDLSYQEHFIDREYVNKFIASLEKHDIKIYILVHASDLGLYKLFLNKPNAFLKKVEGIDLKVSVDVWKDKVVVTSFKDKESTAVLIENEFVADGYKAIFKKLWNIAEDF